MDLPQAARLIPRGSRAGVGATLPPVIDTPLIRLRPLHPGDAAAIAEGVGNWDVVRWLSVVPHPYDVGMARDFIARTRAQRRPTWAIEHDEAVCGIVGLDGGLGFWLARPWWRRGFGFEAAHAAVAHWFADRRAGDLPSGRFADNARSGAVLSALGFRDAGAGRRRSAALAQEVAHRELRLTRVDWQRRLDFRITTGRLTLRPLQVRDAVALASLAGPGIARHAPALAPGLTAAAARDLIARAAWAGHAGFLHGVYLGRRLAGVLACGAEPVSVAVAIAPADRGRGYAREAMRAFASGLFARLPVSRLRAYRFADDAAAERLLSAAGFARTHAAPLRLEPAPAIAYALDRGETR